MLHAKPITATTRQYPNLSTKKVQLSLRLSEYTLKAIDSYCETMNISRNNMIEVMLHFYVRYMALKKQERRSHHENLQSGILQ
jgi:hypothetical protein